MNRIEEAYRKQARLMPSLSISATTPSVNRAMVIAEVRIGEHSPNLAQAANSKPQRPKLISQACGIKLPYPLGLLKETTASGFERPFRYICAWQIMPTAKHTTSSFTLRTNQFSPRENPFSLPTILLFAPKQPPMLWENRDRYHFPNYGIAADAEPCTHAREQAGNNPKTGKMVPVPFPATESLLPFKALHHEFQILLPTKYLHATGETSFVKQAAGTWSPLAPAHFYLFLPETHRRNRQPEP